MGARISPSRTHCYFSPQPEVGELEQGVLGTGTIGAEGLMSAFGGAKGYQPKPPEKGVFPLDHFGECSKEMKQYMKCLKENEDDTGSCQVQAREYFKCRMGRNLMAQGDLGAMGMDGQPGSGQVEKDVSKKKAAKGFIGGMARPEYAKQEGRNSGQ